MSGSLPVRVMVVDTWDQVALEVPDTTLVETLKAEALRRAGVVRPAERYVMKYRGAELWENGATLSDVGVVPNAALVVLPRRRWPVR